MRVVDVVGQRRRTPSGGRRPRRVGNRIGLSARAAASPPILTSSLLDALHRRHVLHVRRELGGLHRVVDEVHEVGGGVRVRRALRDDHRVVPAHPALLGDDELDVGPGRTAAARRRPDQATQATKSPLSRLRRYSLPVKARIWPSFCGLLDLGRRLRTRRPRRRPTGRAPMPSIASPTAVAHLGEHRHLALERRVEQVVDAAQLAPGERRVVGDAGDAGLPRQVVHGP